MGPIGPSGSVLVPLLTAKYDVAHCAATIGDYVAAVDFAHVMKRRVPRAAICTKPRVRLVRAFATCGHSLPVIRPMDCESIDESKKGRKPEPQPR